ncbi:MAG: GTPase [Thermodesulfobacteriota bacterium]|nr:GTPase [Thermodesulfobacteriota bacterium]
MKSSSDTLVAMQDRIDQLDDLAKAGSLLSSSDRDRVFDVCAKAKNYLKKAAQTPLKIGLLGGTGVGKSTIINALAGKTISVVSHKRPYTDKVVVYRHHEAETGFSKDYSFLSPPAVHDVKEIQHIIICDLPDYDSLIRTHQQMVVEFAVELDLLVWVVSPEKYADRSMSELMKLLKKSKNNFSFALNKRDELGENDLARIIGSFTLLLQQFSVDNPRIFSISAGDALQGNGSPGALEFRRFSEFIFRKRKEKELVAIKAANLEEEIEDLAREIVKNLHMGRDIERLIKVLDRTKGELFSLKDVARDEVLGLLDPDLDKRLFSVLEDRNMYLWPVRIVNNILKRISPSVRSNTVTKKPYALPEYAGAIDNRIGSVLADIPCDPPEFSMVRRLKTFIFRNQQSMDTLAELSQFGQRGQWLFIVRQWLYLGVPFLFFLCFMLGIHELSELSEFLDPIKVMKSVYNLPLKLFESDGTTAFISLVLIEGLVCTHLSSRKKKDLENLMIGIKAKIAEGMSDSLMNQLSDEFSQISEWSQKMHKEFTVLKDGYKASV